MNSAPVRVRQERVVLPTYEPLPSDLNPMFLEKRVYQGSSGRVYPLPCCDRIAEQATPRAWDAVFLENDYLAVMLLPALGGRIHRLLDRTSGHDILYHQPVIKPALVGLAGPWASGGIEFNWPQHHRPSTFLPTDVHIAHAPDGAITVWLSEHDPMARMKGMHGVCLHPGRSVLELKVRLHNRTPDTQTFLWWANAAVRVHEHYQSFFPPDCTFVADHARRALSTFPLCTGAYYGVDYGGRARAGVPDAEQPRQYRPPGGYPPNDLSWYANIPVPTSYMAMGSREDFFGGYDHAAQVGLLHVADHRIAPGKKQWTWGNHEFGYAWDRNLTEADGRGEFPPYIELMAGVYTDNQPDFSWLQPGETRTWSQHWYPFRRIGPVQHANVEAAVSLAVDRHAARVGVAVTRRHESAQVTLLHRNRPLAAHRVALSPDAPYLETISLPRRLPAAALTLVVDGADDRELIRYAPVRPLPPTASELAQATATEPPAPDQVAGVDELYLTGLHLEQYRHATRRPEDYWRAGLRRDPGDYRCHLALGRWHLRRGEFPAAAEHLRASVARLTHRNANPADGEPPYQLGRCLRFLGDDAAAADAFAKSAWSAGWRAPALLALAEIACARRQWTDALAHLDAGLAVNRDDLRARNLRAIVLRQLGQPDAAAALLADNLALDPLDWWSRHQLGQPLACDNQVRLDLALDCARAGLGAEALALLADARPATDGTAPLVAYYRAWLHHLAGDRRQSAAHLAVAAAAAPDYCFPARLEEIAILEFAIAANPADARAPGYLGHLLYDRRRHREAIALWEQAVRLDPANSVAWRNLGLAAFNVQAAPARARRAYDAACRARPLDARLLYERDQLWKRTGVAPARRLRELERHPELARTRDDLALELCALYNQTGRPDLALAIVSTRRFQPWEGGEGQALGQHVRTHLLLGRAALAAGDSATARSHFCTALSAPENLGEACHLLANQGDVHFWLGEACAADGDRASAWEHWRAAASMRGDFQQMSVRSFSELSYFAGMALRRLDRESAARKLFRELLAYSRELARAPAGIDYFATSLPAMLLFDDDLAARQQTTALFLEAQARLGLGQAAAARRLLGQVLRRDPAHAAAHDLRLGLAAR